MSHSPAQYNIMRQGSLLFLNPIICLKASYYNNVQKIRVIRTIRVL